jgi:hypothetical protein
VLQQDPGFLIRTRQSQEKKKGKKRTFSATSGLLSAAQWMTPTQIDIFTINSAQVAELTIGFCLGKKGIHLLTVRKVEFLENVSGSGHC